MRYCDGDFTYSDYDEESVFMVSMNNVDNLLLTYVD